MRFTTCRIRHVKFVNAAEVHVSRISDDTFVHAREW